jgi:hypothetical protein
MSRALLAFNPEAHGIGGDTYLFGVPVRAVSPRGVSRELEELDFASHLLEARTEPQIAALVAHLLDRTDTALGRRIDPQTRAQLLPRLTQIGRVVRTALSRSRWGAGTPNSVETIFGTELEGLSPEDQEFETARRTVRLMMMISRRAALAPQDAAPEAAVSQAERLAARHLAPGLSRVLGPPPMGFRARRRARIGR